MQALLCFSAARLHSIITADLCDCRLLQHTSSDGNAMLELLDCILTTCTEFHDALAIRCESAYQTIRRLALYAGTKFLEQASCATANSPSHSQPRLVEVLQQHTDQTSWAAALLQVPISQIPSILPSVLQPVSEVGHQHCCRLVKLRPGILVSPLSRREPCNCITCWMLHFSNKFSPSA